MKREYDEYVQELRKRKKQWNEGTSVSQVKKMFHFVKEGSVLLDLNHIMYIESSKHQLQFHMLEQEQRQYVLYEKLDNLERKLQGKDFLRIHKSYLVNKRHISKIGHYYMLLQDGTELSIPKARYTAVKDEMEIWE